MIDDYQDVLDEYHDIINDKYLNGRSEIDTYIKSTDKLYEWQDVAEERMIHDLQKETDSDG